MIRALDIPAEINLLAFSRYLTRQGLNHRIAEEGGRQVLWVATEQDADLAQSAYARYQSGQLVLQDEAPVSVSFNLGASLTSAVLRFPVTLLLICISLALFPASAGIEEGEPGRLLLQLMFLPTEQIIGNLYFMSFTQALLSGEIWRLFTPMFIHFGWLHIVFNLLWVWEIGRRIEFANGSWLLLALALLSSAVSNLTQHFVSGPSLFGGMSGVVFGLLGHSLVWSRLVPSRSTGLPQGIYIFMLVYLALGFTGIIDLAGMGSIANGAHLGGLVAGLVTGGAAGLLVKTRRSN